MPRPDDAVLQSLRSALGQFEQIDTRINQIFHTVHERITRCSKIDEVHSALKNEVVLLNAKMTLASAKDSYKYIPLMTDFRKTAEAITCMMHLEVLITHTQAKAKTLCNLLASQHHRQALMFYKTKVKECEGLQSKPKIEDKISTLATIFKQVKASVVKAKHELTGTADPAVVQESVSLYEEVILFIQYTSTWLEKEIQATKDTHQEELQLQLDRLNSSIAKKQAALAPIRSDKDSAQIDKTLQDYMQKSKTVKMPNEHYFRNGMRGAKLVYHAVWDQVEKLQDIACALFRVNKTCLERTKDLLNGQSAPSANFNHLEEEIAYYTHIINRLETLTLVQFSDLTKRPPSTKGHACWYYVADLLAQIKEARANLGKLSQIATGSYTFCMRALGILSEYLELGSLEKAGSRHANITKLYEAILAADRLCRKTDRLHKRTYKVIHDTLALQGPKTLVLTKQEAKIPDIVFENNPFYQDEAQILQSYVMKRLVQYVRFSENTIDPEFDSVLFVLQNNVRYKDWLMHCSTDFKRLLDVYIKGSVLPNNSLEFNIFSCALYALHAIPHALTSKIDFFMSYHEAKELLDDLKVSQHAASLLPHVAWLESKIYAFSRKHEDSLNIDDELSQPPANRLFKSLITSLFSSHHQKFDSVVRLLEVLQEPNFRLPSLDTVIGVLLRRFALKRFMVDKADITMCEKSILYTLFIQYLSDASAQNFWQDQYDLGFMEMALCQFVECKEFNMQEIIFQTRTEVHYELWQNVVGLYAKARNSYAQVGHKASQKEALECLEKAKALVDETCEETINLGIAKWCIQEMMQLTAAK